MLSDIIVQLELTHPMDLLFHVFGFDYVLREDGLAKMMTEQVTSIGNLGRQDRLIAIIHDLFLQQLIFDKVKLVQRLLNFLLEVDHLADEIVTHEQGHIILNHLVLGQPKHLLLTLDHFALIGLKL